MPVQPSQALNPELLTAAVALLPPAWEVKVKGRREFHPETSLVRG